MRTRILVVAAVGLPLALTGLAPAVATRSGCTLSDKVVHRRVIGRSVEGRPIRAVEKGNPDASRAVVLVGQMHGDEKAGVRTARYVIGHVPVCSDTDLWVVPTMNPDGYAHDTRQNAHGVDLNRNWPMNWRRGRRGPTYPGPRAASEPETRAMMAFLTTLHPRFVTSIHQPYGEVGYDKDKPIHFQRRLARYLHLPLVEIDVGGPTLISHERGLQPGGADNAPTLTGWYNAHFRGTAITVEYTRHPTRRFKTVLAGRGILRASLAGR